MERALRPGTLVHKRYRLERVLGEGGFGITYLAWDEKDQVRVALKEYMPMEVASRRPLSQSVVAKAGSESNFDRFRERFLDEAKIIYRYRGHPNIVRVSHLFYDNNTAYYAMEYIEGMDLGQYLRQKGGRLSWSELKPIIAQAVAALHEVHKGGIIHCDISPDNIFLRKGGQVTLIDFGAAKSIIGGQSSIVVVKRGYAPPEQYSNRGELGPWTDVYALAATIYRCLFGAMPPAASDRLVTGSTLPVRFPFMPDDPLQYILSWNNAMQKAFSLQIRDRWQSVDAFWRALTGSSGWYLVDSYEGLPYPITGETVCSEDKPQSDSVHHHLLANGSAAMRLWLRDGKLMGMDLGKPRGVLMDGYRLTPGLVYELREGAVLRLNNGPCYFVARF